MQKFHKGDWVQVANDLGQSMSHFTAGCEAIVIGSFKDKYGGSDTGSYTLHLKDGGRTSWYYENQLTLIEGGKLDKLKQWEDKADSEQKQKSNIDWIFSNGVDVIANPHSASISALAKCFGVTNLWGSNGEGFVYYQNAMTTLAMAKPYIEAADKTGWLTHCETLMVNVI